MRVLIFDLETSISKHKYHSESKDQITDFYTVIWGSNPNDIKIKHKETGFKRTLPHSFFKSCTCIVGCNLSFDFGYIYKQRCFQDFIRDESNSVWDVQEAEYIITGQRHKYASLSELQAKYLGHSTKLDRISKLFSKGLGADEILKRRTTHKRIFALYENYCIDDGRSTLLVFAEQYKLAKKLNMLNIVKARMRGLLAVIMMQNTGMLVDLQATELTLRDFRLKELDYLKQATDLVKDLWDERLGEFNINSPKQKSAILFGGEFIIKEKEQVGMFKNGKPKFKLVDKTIKIDGFKLDKRFTSDSKVEGRFKTDNNVINEIYKHCDNRKAVEYCKLQKLAMKYGKMCSTYLEPFLNYSVDGILYPHYNTNATETSRLSSSTPNLQNVPASGEMNEAIQGKLIAPTGYLACDIDYTQLEPFITALLTNDTNLTSDLLNSVCLHCRAVSWIPRLSEGKSYDEIYDLAVVKKVPEWVLKRKKAKGINFKRAYGGGAKSLAEAEELDIEDVKTIFEEQDIQYSQVKEFNDRLYNNLKENQQLSKISDFSKRIAKSKVFNKHIELLPVYDNAGNKAHYKELFRHYGTYRNPFGHLFTFEELGRRDKKGNIVRMYSTTETKNYHIQGTAGDIVQCAMTECMMYVLKNAEEVRMVRQIHDSLGFYIKDNENLHKHITNLCAIMSDIKTFLKKHFNYEAAFNFRVEAKVGKNFGELKEYEQKRST